MFEKIHPKIQLIACNQKTFPFVKSYESFVNYFICLIAKEHFGNSNIARRPLL